VRTLNTFGIKVLFANRQWLRSIRRWTFIFSVAICVAGVSMEFAIHSHGATPFVGERAEFALATSVETLKASTDFSKFGHASESHSRLPCLLCHRRDSNEAQPKFSGHTPCAGCHAQEFANAGSQICTICHSNAQSGATRTFPKLKSFNVKFDHARHVGSGRTSSQCGSCHRPERRGVSLSIPGGLGGHSTCFQCHSPRSQGRSGQDISSCSTCHTLAGYARTPEGSRAYAISFSHAKHGAGKKLNCSSCHSIRPGMPQRRQVTSPVPAMHAASARVLSCMSCHDNKRAFGVENSSDCKKCHQGTTWRM
jgi:c(7)-type cytochrome triheme protein